MNQNIFYRFFLLLFAAVNILSAQTSQYRFRMRVLGNTVDECVVRFHPLATIGYDSSFDAYKIYSSNPAAVGIGTVSGTEDYAINSLPLQGLNTTIPLRVLSGINGNFSIVFEPIDTLPPSMCLFLIDSYNGNVTDLKTQPVYSCQLSDTSYSPRFSILINGPLYIDAIPVSCSGGLNGKIKIFNFTQINYVAQVDGLSGQGAFSHTGNDSVFTFNNLTSGQYLVSFLPIGNCFPFADTLDLGVGSVAASFAPSQDTVDITTGAQVYFSNQSVGADSYLWDFGDGSPVDTSFNPMHSFAAVGDYTVTLIAAYLNCSDTVSQQITVVDVTGLTSQHKQNSFRFGPYFFSYPGVPTGFYCYSLDGRLLFCGNPDLDPDLIWAQLPSGIYLAQILFENGLSKQTKLVKH